MACGHSLFSGPKLEGHCAIRGHLDHGQRSAHSLCGNSFQEKQEEELGPRENQEGCSCHFQIRKGKVVFLWGPEDGEGRDILKTKESFGHRAGYRLKRTA